MRQDAFCENLPVKLTSIDNDMQRRALSRILIGPGAANVKGELSRPSFSRPTAQIVNRLTQLRRGKGGIFILEEKQFQHGRPLREYAEVHAARPDSRSKRSARTRCDNAGAHGCVMLISHL
jgi:hypothetical protein